MQTFELTVSRETVSRYQRSTELFQRAQESLAGGVSSNVRALAQPPLYFRSGAGARIVDADENVYLDYTLSQGPMFLGHSPPAVLDFVERAMRNGQLCGGRIFARRQAIYYNPRSEDGWRFWNEDLIAE